MKKQLIYLILSVLSGFTLLYPHPGNTFFDNQFVFEDSINNKIINGENFSGRDIISLALTFSGFSVSDEKARGILNKYDDLEKKLVVIKKANLKDCEKAERILSFMFEFILKSYREEKTTIDAVFENGEYNCVTSAILFIAFGKAVGLDVRGQKTIEHAFCKLYANDCEKKEYIIETTNPYGFDPGSKNLTTEDKNYLKYIVVPKINYVDQKEINDLYLTAVIAENLTVLAMENKNYNKALPVAYGLFGLKEYFSIEGEKSVENLFSAVCTNYVFYLQSEGLFEESLKFICQLNSLNPDSGKNLFGNKLNLAIENYFYEKIQKKDFENAKKICEMKNSFVSPTLFKELEIQWWIYKIQEEMIPVLDNNCSVDILDEKLLYLSGIQLVEDDELIRQKIYKYLLEWKEYIWQKKIIFFAEKNDFGTAISLIDEALNELSNTTKIINLKKQVLKNYEAWIHNKFAESYNKSKFDDAGKILEEGILVYPESRILKKDMEMLKKD